MKLKSFHYFIIFVVIAVAAIIASRMWAETQPGKFDELAQCINDSGAQFYGAFWCPHCEEQLELFGNSQKLLPYNECSTPDGQRQTQICIDKEIKNYPTWDFADGNRVTGVQSLQSLADATACEITSP